MRRSLHSVVHLSPCMSQCCSCSFTRTHREKWPPWNPSLSTPRFIHLRYKSCIQPLRLWFSADGKLSQHLLSPVLERQRQDQTSPELETLLCLAWGCWVLGDGGEKLGTVPLFNLLLRDTGFSAGSRWEGAGSKKGVQLENGGRWL